MPERRRRADWSRSLPRPLVIPGIIKLVTLGDVRQLIERHLPPQVRSKATWRYVAAQLATAAQGADAADVAVSLRLALSMEGVSCRPQ